MSSLIRFLVVFLIFPCLVHAQLTKNNDYNFGAAAVHIGFPSVKDGADATDLLAKYGVRFSANLSTARVRIVEFPPSTPPVVPIPGPLQGVAMVRNEARSGSSAGIPLRIDLTQPVRAISFLLRNPNTPAVIKAFNGDGLLLGTVNEPAGTQEPHEVCLVTSASERIAKVIIDFGDANLAEEVTNLTIERDSAPLFETYLPQIGDGVLPNGLRLKTSITIISLASTTVAGQVLFLDPDGQPLPLLLANQSVATWQPVSGYENNVITSSGTSNPPQSGYAKVTSGSPVTAMAAYQLVDSQGMVVQETSVLGTSARYTHRAPVEQIAPKGMVGGAQGPTYETALALANVSDQPNVIDIQVWGSAVVGIQIPLDPGEQRAVFLNEIFPDAKWQDLRGWLSISGTQPSVAILLKTKDRLPVSAIPVDSLER